MLPESALVLQTLPVDLQLRSFRPFSLGALEPALAVLAFVLGALTEPSSGWVWATVVMFSAGAAISSIALLPGTAVVAVGLAASLGLPPNEVSGAGLALFIPIFAAIRRSSRFSVAITLILTALGFYTMIIHSAGDQLTAAAVAVFPTLWLLVVGAGLLLRAGGQQLEEERRNAAERLTALRLELARDLHDNAVHKVSQAAMRANINALGSDTPPELAREFTAIAASCNDAAHELRLLLANLRAEHERGDGVQPQIVDADALRALIDDQATRLASLGFGVDQQISVKALNSLQCRTLAAITIEAVNNMVDHAVPGSACVIQIDQDEHQVHAHFVNRVDSGRRRVREAFGLLGIEERAKAAGGYISVENQAGRWRLTVVLPNATASQQAHQPADVWSAHPRIPPKSG